MKPKQITQAYIAACIGMAFFGITMVALGAVLPALSRHLSLTAAHQATLASALTGGIFAGSIVFGPVCDHYGHKGIFLAACVMVLLGLLGIAQARGFAILVPSYFLVGAGGGILNGQTNTLVSDLYDTRRRGPRLSLLGAFYGVGGMAITLLVSLFKYTVAYDVVLKLLVAFMVLCAIYCATVRFPAPKAAQSFPLGKAVRMLGDPVLLVMSLVLMLESTIETITNNLSTIYFQNHGLDEVVLLLTVMMASLTVARFALSWLAGKIAQQSLLYLFLSVLLAGFVMVLLGRNFAMATVAMILIGVGTAATYPVVLGQIGTAYAQLSGTAFGIAITTALAGSTVLNAMVGSLLLHIYPYVMMAAVAAMMLLYTAGNVLLKNNKYNSLS